MRTGWRSRCPSTPILRSFTGWSSTGKWRGTIYASDLTRDTPYNTYLHAGLPPGPVANPGIPSLRAAMDPAKTNYLYFVAAGTDAQGHSLFAETLDEHNRNVAEYRNAQQEEGRWTMKIVHRSGCAAALALPLLLAGCSLFPTTRHLPALRPATVNSATPQELVNQIDQRWDALKTHDGHGRNSSHRVQDSRGR